MIKLLIYQDGKPIAEYQHSDIKKEITIGRAPGCSVRLELDAVSRLHALIRRSNDAWLLEKRTEKGSLKVNDQEVEDAILNGGEEIHIADFSIRVQVEGTASKSTNFQQNNQKAESLGVDDGQAEESDFPVVEGEKTRFSSVAMSAFFKFDSGSANVSEFYMKNDVAVFGRANNCDVILSEKRASRKHFEVRRQGISFILKDLDSANGTHINGKKVSEAELVAGDLIQVGESSCQFSVENKEYFSQQDNFLPVPSQLEEPPEEEAPSDDSFMQEGGAGDASFDSQNLNEVNFGTGEEGQISNEPPPEGIKGLWFKYKNMPKYRRYMVLLIILVAGGALFNGEEDDDKKTQTKKPIPVVMKDGKRIRVIEALAKDKQSFVKKMYDELKAANEKHDFVKMKELISKINQYVDEYKQVKEFEQIAKRGIDEIEKKERERAQKEREDKLRMEADKAIALGKEVYAQAMKSKTAEERARIANDKLEKVIQEIYSKDPNNSLPQEWRAQIKAKDDKERAEKEVARLKEEKRKEMQMNYEEVERIFSEGKYKTALLGVAKLKELGYVEYNYNKKIVDLENRIKQKVFSLVDPLLKMAAEQRKEGGDLVKSNEFYGQVIRIDPDNKEAMQGMQSIRNTLVLTAKRIYTDAVLSESIGDLHEAKDGFAKCMKVSPEDDIYRKKCKNKLSKYEGWAGGGSAQQ